MFIESYDELKKKVFTNCQRDDELTRVVEEAALFEKNGWEKYIIFICNFFTSTIPSDDYHPIFSLINKKIDDDEKSYGSVMDSYFVFKSHSSKISTQLLSLPGSVNERFSSGLWLCDRCVDEEIWVRKYKVLIMMLCEQLRLQQMTIPFKRNGPYTAKASIIISQDPRLPENVDKKKMEDCLVLSHEEVIYNTEMYEELIQIAEKGRDEVQFCEDSGLIIRKR